MACRIDTLKLDVLFEDFVIGGEIKKCEIFYEFRDGGYRVLVCCEVSKFEVFFL